MSTYKPTIGVECHIQLKTKTKLFAPVGNDAREAPPNTLISHICLGMPGALPVLNKGAVELAIKAAHAFNTRAQKYSSFDRKHYFYPDLPLGYQITQFYHPIITNGKISIWIDGTQKEVRIREAHLESDAGKSTHPAGKNYSLVDLNRAGTPLLEVVSEPDIHSAKEAKAYAQELYLIAKYAGISEADLYYGNIRFDVNVSVSNSDELGTRTETKNLNSFRSVEKAVEYEIKRQTELLQKGEKIVQETRGWDDAKQRTFSQRSKEDAHDYRYMPDPDIPPLHLEDDFIDGVLSEMGPTVDELRQIVSSSGASVDLTETILDMPEVTQAVVAVSEFGNEDKDSVMVAVQWLGQLVPKIAESTGQSISKLFLNPEKIIKLATMFKENLVSSTVAKEIFEKILTKDVDPESYAQEQDMLQVSDTAELEKTVKEVLDANQKAAEDVKAGEMKAIGFLVGQVMKASGGKANPGLVQEIIKKLLA